MVVTLRQAFVSSMPERGPQAIPPDPLSVSARSASLRNRPKCCGAVIDVTCQLQTKSPHRGADDCRPLHLALHRQEIGVAGQTPLTVETLLQNSERLASPSNRLAAR